MSTDPVVRDELIHNDGAAELSLETAMESFARDSGVVKDGIEEALQDDAVVNLLVIAFTDQNPAAKSAGINLFLRQIEKSVEGAVKEAAAKHIEESDGDAEIDAYIDAQDFAEADQDA